MEYEEDDDDEKVCECDHRRWWGDRLRRLENLGQLTAIPKRRRYRQNRPCEFRHGIWTAARTTTTVVVIKIYLYQEPGETKLDYDSEPLPSLINECAFWFQDVEDGVADDETKEGENDGDDPGDGEDDSGVEEDTLWEIVGNKTEQKRTVIKELLYSSSRHEDNELKERKANDPAWAGRKWA